jgi:LacI family transcriptional regulator
MLKKRHQVTLADVARLAGVSAKTVSRVVNNDGYVSAETRAQIQQAIDTLGYRPNRMARSLASNRSFIIGLTIPDVTNPFFPEILRGVEQVARTHGYTVLALNTDLDPSRERDGLALLEETRADGVIVCTMRLEDDELRAYLQRQRAAVLVNRTLAGGAAGVVRVNLYEAVRRIVQLLIDHGRQQIGYLNVVRSAQSYSSQQRFQGFSDAMAANGRAIEPVCIGQSLATVEASYEAARALLTRCPQMDALVCYNDMLAAGALEACASLGLAVPDQIAVTGFDNIMFSSVFRVPLTTAHVPKLELGSEAAQMLFDRIDGHTEPAEKVLDAELIIRQSAP